MVILILCLLCATATHASFERALFPLHDNGLRAQPGPHPARLATAIRPCGGFGVDRPFGLARLSGHRLQAILPLPGMVVGGGVGLRGPAQHREQGVWLALARRFGDLRAGLAIQRLSWRGARGGQASLSYVIGLGVALPLSWSIELLLRPSSQVAPRRLSLTVRHREADGSLAASWRQRSAHDPALSWAVTKRLNQLHMSGEVTGLMRRTGVGVGWHGTPSIFVHSQTHAVLGRSTSAWVGRLCQ